LLVLLAVVTVQPVEAEVKVVELDNVWLQELKVRVGGGTIRDVTYSGVLEDCGYTKLSGGIYDDFTLFENGAYIVEGKHVVAIVDKQELDFWAGGKWCLPSGEYVVGEATGEVTSGIHDAYYPNTVGYYLEIMENSIYYWDEAYTILAELFHKTPDPAYTDGAGRINIVYLLAKPLWGNASYPITVGGEAIMEFEPPYFVNDVPFHEIGHTFTGGREVVGRMVGRVLFKIRQRQPVRNNL
jgi:hypothetical protein